jgi:hypothetical protein
VSKAHQQRARTTERVQSVLKKTCFISLSTGDPLFFHIFSTAARVRLSPWLLALVLAGSFSQSGASAEGQEASLFRIFLVSGESLVSYGEYARVADTLVFTVPLGDTSATPALHMVSIPASSVDWRRTEDYANAVRAKRYAETRGEEDFALLASRVTQALNDINLNTDPKRRIAMAEEARRNLAAWPAANYGYRAADVAQLVAMLDDVVAEMRTKAGDGSFALSLVATTVAPPIVAEVIAPPSAEATLELAFRAALATEQPSERVNLLRAIASFPAPAEPASATSFRSRVNAALQAELNIEKAYGDLARASLKEADQRAKNGDPRALRQVIARALAADDRLGQRRPGQMSALLATLDLRLEQAQRVRVAQDAWMRRVDVFKDYRQATRSSRDRMTQLTPQLRLIRDRKGTTIRPLERVEMGATIAIHELRMTEVPPELASAHNLMITAFQLARQAASARRYAISSKNTTLAWDASSAAAGALLMAERAVEELERLISAKDPIPR